MTIFLLGFCCGYLIMAMGQVSLEREYVREGIAKLRGKFYKLTLLNGDGSEDNGDE